MSHSDLYIVDNSADEKTVLKYLSEWCSVSKQMDIATGYLEVGGLLALDQSWQKMDKIRILLGNEMTARTIEARIDEYNKKRPDHPILRVGPVKLLELQAAFELSRRANILLDAEFRSKNLKSSSAAYNVFAGIVAASPEQEHFYVLPTDSDFHPLCDPIAITKGTASRTIVHPRDVFREAIRWNAHSIIVAHNHPCGDPTPSDEDIEMTKQLIDIAKLHSIPLLDHLVLGSPRSADGKGYVSIRNLAVLKF